MADRVWAERLAAQGLTGDASTSVEAVVERLLAVQAQDPRGARLAVRARSTGLTARDVDAALDERRCVVSWLNRGTLHLVLADDYWWLQPLTTPQLATSNATRLRQEGVSAEQADLGVQVVVDALADEGPLVRAALKERLAAAGVPTAGQAVVHVLLRASILGHIVRGPMHGREQAFVLVRDWLGRPPAVDRHEALARLARRYLRGHGPASDRDLARWAGVPLRDARAGLAAIRADLVDRGDGLAALATPSASRGMPPPRLLGAYEPVLLGWVSREQVLGLAPAHRLVTDNGLFRPFALVGGQAVATWRREGSRVELDEFTDVQAADRKALDADAVDVTRFLDG